MKRIMLTALLLAGTLGLAAQNRGDREWFFGTGAGINIGFDGESFTNRTQSHTGAGLGINLYGGRWFGRVVGLRGGYQGISVSNRFTDFGQMGFHYVHADLLVRVAQGFVPYLHTGFVWMDAGSPTFGAGIMAPIRLGGHVSLVPDIRYTALNGHAFKDGEVRFAGSIGLTLGLRFDFGEPISKKKAAAVREKKKDNEKEKKSFSKVPKVQRNVVLVYFIGDSPDLTLEASLKLDPVISFLQQENGVNAVLSTYRAPEGTDDFGSWLSERQLQAVRDYLLRHGISPTRLQTAYQSSTSAKGKVQIGFVR